MIRKKCELRAQLALETAKIQSALVYFSEAEHQELRALLEKQGEDCDGDILALKQESTQLEAEARAVGDIKPLAISLSRGATKILHNEIERRLSLGHCPAVELVVEQGLRRAYG